MDGHTLVIRSRANTFRRQMRGQLDADTTLLWNGICTSRFTVDDDHEIVTAATEKGARCEVLLGSKSLYRGRVSATPGTGPKGTVEIQTESDHRKFRDWLGWQNPTAPIGGQVAKYKRYSGPTETIVKAAFQDTLTRLGVSGWVVVPTLGRGPTRRVEFRMNSLADKLFPLLVAAKLGLQITYSGNTAVMDLRSPNTIAGVMTVETARIDRFTFDRNAPSATRAVIGGPTVDDVRTFDLVVDTSREADWGDIVEMYVDAANADDGADMKDDGWAALADADAKTAINLALAETKVFRFGQHYELGDLLPVDLGGVKGTEVISTIRITESPGDGVKVVPSVGQIDKSGLQMLGRQLTRTQARIRELGRR